MHDLTASRCSHPFPLVDRSPRPIRTLRVRGVDRGCFAPVARPSDRSSRPRSARSSLVAGRSWSRLNVTEPRIRRGVGAEERL
ncbi:hypothetical protein BD413DRAFT_565811 [Trametes elegans]|nr:hypothetical protein BD413DRAFT_565811 [Trametes elegans]